MAKLNDTMEWVMSRPRPHSFQRGLQINEAWDIHAAHLSRAKTAEEYNKAATAAILCLDSHCILNELKRVAATFLSKFGDDALDPLWVVIAERPFTLKEKEFFFTHWPNQFAKKPQGKVMPKGAAKRVAPETILSKTSKNKQHAKDVWDVYQIDCRAKRHHSLPSPSSTMAGYSFYVYEELREAAMVARAEFLGLLAFLGRRRAGTFFWKFLHPMGSFALAGRTLLAMLGSTKAPKKPRGYMPYLGCSCDPQSVDDVFTKKRCQAN
jgi:hypothetical protein